MNLTRPPVEILLEAAIKILLTKFLDTLLKSILKKLLEKLLIKTFNALYKASKASKASI